MMVNIQNPRRKTPLSNCAGHVRKRAKATAVWKATRPRRRAPLTLAYILWLSLHVDFRYG